MDMEIVFSNLKVEKEIDEFPAVNGLHHYYFRQAA
jgi:hypothetical protein